MHEKYLRSKKSQGFISFTSGLSVAGIAIGVMALIVVLSVMNGFEEDIHTKILGTQSHIVISNFTGGISDPESVLQTVMKQKGVVAATPFILSPGLVSSPGGISGVVIRGINPESAPRSSASKRSSPGELLHTGRLGCTHRHGAGASQASAWE